MPKKANLEALEKLLLSRAKQSNCQSYVEFLANQALIESYLTKGYKAITIWQVLSEQGLISFKYSTFSSYLRKHRAVEIKPPIQADPDQAGIEPSPPIETDTSKPITQGNQSQTAIKLKLPEGMSHNPMINPKDLI
jgi:Family of unknown function (DUF5338)